MDPDFKVSKLKKIDYDKLLNATNEYKKRSEESFNKVNSIFQKAKQSKVNSKLIEHKKIWNYEAIRLNKQKRKLQREIDQFIASSNYDLTDLKDTISEDHIDFRSTVIEPVFLLCEDVKEWNIKKRSGQKVPNSEPIQDLVASTNNKLNQIANQLEAEKHTLSVVVDKVHQYHNRPLSLETIYERVGTGIPIQLYNLLPAPEKPRSPLNSFRDEMESDDESEYEMEAVEIDEEQVERDRMMSELLSQFIELDELYQTKLDTLSVNMLQQNHSKSTRILNDKFSEHEYEQFKFLHEYYYSNTTVNRHQMFMDACKIVFSHHAQSHIASLEEYVTKDQCFQDALQALVSDWRSERRELMVKIKLTIEEYKDEMVAIKLQNEERQKQQNLCVKLTHQVTEWRKMKQEKEELEAELNRQKLAEEKMETDLKFQKERENREKTKQRIMQYKREKSSQEQKMWLAKQQRLEELQSELEKQAKMDRERIRFRQDLWYEKQWEQELSRMEREEQKKISETKLMELADSVKPQVKYDPDRIHKATEAWRHHISEDSQDNPDSSQHGGDSSSHWFDDSNTRLNRPLYTYTDKSILSDPRVRVEAALRQAGLIQKEYVRKVVLQNIQPAHLTRKDNQLSGNNFLKE